MADKSHIERNLLISHRVELRKALVDLVNLHVWPANKDIAQFEEELLTKLAFIECKLIEDALRRGLAQRVVGLLFPLDQL